MNIFAIGDIHGCLNQLINLQDKIFKDLNFNQDKDTLLYLGDYIDRGLQSKGVIDRLIKLQKEFQHLLRLLPKILTIILKKIIKLEKFIVVRLPR